MSEHKTDFSHCESMRAEIYAEVSVSCGILIINTAMKF